MKCKTRRIGFTVPTDRQLDMMTARAFREKSPTTARVEACAVWPAEDKGIVEGKRVPTSDKRLVNRLKMCFAHANKQWPWAGAVGRPQQD